MLNYRFEIPQEVEYIIEKLNGSGYEAYAIGGCVRDSILVRMPRDWDIATSARPDQIKDLFEKTVDTGIKHGTVTAVVMGKSFEITTYRVDGVYENNRRPSKVDFTSSLKEDASRRDFTINSIAFHPVQGLIDHFNGVADIENKRIRTVGDPDRRFGEDALRMLRAVRFSAELDFDVDAGVIRSIKDNSVLIKNISQERIREELSKILVSGDPIRFILLRDTHLLQYILPEFEICFHTAQNHPYHIYNVAIHTLKAVACVPCDRILRWAMLLHDIGKPLTRTVDDSGIDHFYGHPEKSVQLAEIVLRRLRFDNKSISKILRLIRHHDRRVEPTHKAVRKAAAAVGDDIFTDLLKVQEADKRAQNPEFFQERLEKLEQVRKIYYEIKEAKNCINLKDLAVNGDDLIGAGFQPGKEMRIMLERLLDAVTVDPELNSREKLLELAGRIRSGVNPSE